MKNLSNKEILVENIKCYIQKEISNFLTDEVDVFCGRGVIENIEFYTFDIVCNKKHYKIEGISLSEVLCKFEQLENLLSEVLKK